MSLHAAKIPVDTVTPQEAAAATEAGALLIDVLGEAQHAAVHAKGALGHTVYAMAFVGEVTKAAEEKGGKDGADVILIGYDNGPRSQEAAVAAQQLLDAGFKKVRVVEGGLQAYVLAGLPLEGSFSPPLKDVAQLGPIKTTANAADSKLKWTGRSIFGSSHRGLVPLVSGSAEFGEDGALVAAEFTLDIANLTNEDIPKEAPWHNVLLAHLASDDFFSSAKFPTATVVLKSAERVPATAQADRSYTVTASLQLKGVTNDIEFTALAIPLNPKRIGLQAIINIERSRWGVLYGNPTLYTALGGHLVSDTITLDVHLQLDVVE